MLEWKFCCYLSLAEFDLVAFVRLFRLLLIRIDILKAFLIHLLPLHEMKISQSDLWVQMLHKWLYSQGVVHPRPSMCPSYKQVKQKLHSAQRFNTFAHRETFPLPSQCILYLRTNTPR